MAEADAPSVRWELLLRLVLTGEADAEGSLQFGYDEFVIPESPRDAALFLDCVANALQQWGDTASQEARAAVARMRALASLVLGDQETAFQWFEEAFDLAPGDWHHRLNAAGCALAQAEASRALSLLEPMLSKLRPEGDACPDADAASVPDSQQALFWSHLARAEMQAGNALAAVPAWLRRLDCGCDARVVEEILTMLDHWSGQTDPAAVAQGAAEQLLAGLQRRQPLVPWIQSLELGCTALQVRLRTERAEDLRSVDALLACGFPGRREGQVLNQLRVADAIHLSLVAELDGLLVGHLAFSTVACVRSDGRVDGGLALAPLTVDDAYRRQGIASRLVQLGLDLLRENGVPWVVLVGGLHFYRRFGFVPASQFALEEPNSCRDEFLALELTPGSLTSTGGVVVYP